MKKVPDRYINAEDFRNCVPVYAVWETTLRCNLACSHCGSRAGRARANELSTAECLEVVRQLAALGTREITIIGGEAYIRSDWLEIIRAITEHGMECSMTTGGLNLSQARLDAAAKAGLKNCSISVDGLQEVHDRLRGVRGSYNAAVTTISRIADAGITASANTQITRMAMGQLPQLMDVLIEKGARNWQVQLTVAMGNAADHPELLLQPYDLLELVPVLADLFHSGLKRNLLLQPGNNIGYFGPYEHLWRGNSFGEGHWIGCNAGQNTIGIEADGTIKGCPSLPTSDYAGGNIRERSIADIWRNARQLSFTRDRTVNDLWGFCKSCYYADVCHGGCSWTTHVLFGRPGNNPLCHYRALTLAKKGIRERLVKVKSAPGKPFDYGKFELIEESICDPVPDSFLIPEAK